MARGDHIYVKCRSGLIPFHHHGIDMGDGTVIHLVGANGQRAALGPQADFCVRRDTLADFSRGEIVHTQVHENARPADEIVTAAEGLIGQAEYDLLDNNCEHFATYCATGTATSSQIELSQATVKAFVSVAAKTASVVSSRAAARFAMRSATKLHPAALLADGVEIAVLTGSCSAKLSPERSQRLARVSGSVAAAGVGVVVGGPLGAAAFLAAHTTSTAIAQHTVDVARKLLRGSPAN